MHALRVLEAAEKGRSSVVEAAANKVAHTEVCQRIARAALDLGAEALVRGGALEFLWRQSAWETIGGRTSEVMRGVVARQGLGLGGGKVGFRALAAPASFQHAALAARCGSRRSDAGAFVGRWAR